MIIFGTRPGNFGHEQGKTGAEGGKHLERLSANWNQGSLAADPKVSPELGDVMGPACLNATS